MTLAQDNYLTIISQFIDDAKLSKYKSGLTIFLIHKVRRAGSKDISPVLLYQQLIRWAKLYKPYTPTRKPGAASKFYSRHLKQQRGDKGPQLVDLAPDLEQARKIGRKLQYRFKKAKRTKRILEEVEEGERKDQQDLPKVEGHDTTPRRPHEDS